jgi:hypothetical protein
MSAGEPPRIEPWHERLLRNGDHNNERLFMQAEIDDLRAALVSRLAPAESVAALQASMPPATLTTMPISVALRDTEAIAMYLRRSINRVRNDIVSLPTFPRPIRLPVQGRSQALYKAREVVA